MTKLSENIIKYGKNCEMVMWSSGDVFCSLSDEELEVERKAAIEDEERFHKLMLIEKSSKMNLDDFIQEYKRWEEQKLDHETWLSEIRDRRDWRVHWDEYIYERDTYDTNKATAVKIKRYKKLGMIVDHAVTIITLILGIFSYSSNFIFSLFMFGIAGWNTVGVSMKWYHMYTERDVSEYVNG